MASIHRNPGSPFWTASVRLWVAMPDHPHGGFWRRSRRSTGVPVTRPKRDAVLVANEIERASAALKDGVENPQRFFEQTVARLMLAAGVSLGKSVPTWRAWSETWLSGLKCKPRTVLLYRRGVKEFSCHLGARAKCPLNEVTHEDCQAFYDAQRKGGASSATAYLNAKIVRMAMERAVVRGILQGNPARLIHLDASDELSREPFTVEELRAILATVEHEKEWRVAVGFGLLCAMRIGDATARRFDEISEQDGMRCITFLPQKKSRRGKPVTLPLVGELSQLKGRGLITPRLAKLNNPGSAFMRILKRAGVHGRTQKTRAGASRATKSFHSLRHTINTMLLNGGVDVRIRQLVSDHESQAVNAAYSHPALKTMNDALCAIAGAVMQDEGIAEGRQCGSASL